MSAQHKRPLLAFVILVVVCAFVVGRAVRAEAFDRLVAEGVPIGVLAPLAPDLAISADLGAADRRHHVASRTAANGPRQHRADVVVGVRHGASSRVVAVVHRTRTTPVVRHTHQRSEHRTRVPAHRVPPVRTQVAKASVVRHHVNAVPAVKLPTVTTQPGKTPVMSLPQGPRGHGIVVPPVRQVAQEARSTTILVPRASLRQPTGPGLVR